MTSDFFARDSGFSLALSLATTQMMRLDIFQNLLALSQNPKYHPQQHLRIKAPFGRKISCNLFAWLAGSVIEGERKPCRAPTGTPQTNILVLGTALHRDCLVLHLTRTAGWQARTFKAIEKWPERMDLWAGWEETYVDVEDPEHEVKARQFYEQNRQAMDQGAVLLWPEREDLYTLMTLRATIGAAAFASEKQGDPVNPEACEWPSEYFDGPGFWFEQWPASLLFRVLSLDPSKGKDADKGDYSALVKIGIDKAGVMFVEADLQRRPTPQIVADGVEMVRQFKPDGFAIEINQFQELLCADFLRVGQEQRTHLPIFEINNQVNKNVRIRRLGPYLSQRKLRFKTRSPGTALLVQQLRDFPVGDHDDGPDAVEQGLRLLIELWNSKAQHHVGRIVT